MRFGDYFLIPMEDGRSAVCQIIWLGNESKEQKFKKIFAFGVLSIGDSKEIPVGGSYLSFDDYRGGFIVIFTAIDKLKTGEWPILQSGEIDDFFKDFEFNMAGALYSRGQPVRVLSFKEYKNYLLMSVSGYALVEDYLQRH
ncbi:hypothetical protein QEM13_004169 [Pseudomonas putida]|nr:hypothetical protein [Pseudomonas putida]